MALSSFERWKRDYPVTYEILFNLFYRWSQACTNRNGYDKIEHLWEYHKSSMGRWKTTDPAVAKNVRSYRIQDMYFSHPGRKLSFKAEFEYTNHMGEPSKTDITTELIEADTLYAIESEALDYFGTKVIGKPIADKEEDKPAYKKPGVTYQHVSTAKPGSTETQKVIERMLKTSVHIDTDTPWTTINPDLNRKVMEYAESDAEAVATYYEELNKEKETKEMKKLIINHNAVIVLTGAKDSYGKEKKTVVNILDKKTKKERGQWNTKLAVVSAIAKSFEHHRDGKLSTCYKLYEMLNTIKKPTNATIDFVADEMYQNNKRLKCYKWYQEAIKVKRPAPGKSVVIVMEDK